MNELMQLRDSERLTMSSLEIATLTGKRHDHVMRDIRIMLAELYGEGGVPSFGGVYTDAKGEKRPCFNLPKRETYILVSGYNVQMRAKIVDRWEELESGKALPVAAIGDLTEIVRRQIGGIVKAVVLKAVNETLPDLVHGEIARQNVGIRHGKTAEAPVWSCRILTGRQAAVSWRMASFIRAASTRPCNTASPCRRGRDGTACWMM